MGLEPLEPLARELRQLLAELSRVTQLVEKSEVGCCGLTLAQCHLLLVVAQGKGGGTAPSDVATTLGLDLSTVSRVADGLVRQNLLVREVDPADRRRNLLFPTAAGKELVRFINQGMNTYARTVLEQIPADKRFAVLESLRLLIAALRQAKGGCCCE